MAYAKPYSLTVSPTGDDVESGFDKVDKNIDYTVVSLNDLLSIVGTSATAGAVLKAGSSMSGNLIMTTGTVVTLNDAPSNNTDASNKVYVDSTSLINAIIFGG